MKFGNSTLTACRGDHSSSTCSAGGKSTVESAGNYTTSQDANVGSGSVIADANRANVPDAIFNLEFTPRQVLPDTTRFKFEGTWRNYKAHDCTATVRARFQKRT